MGTVDLSVPPDDQPVELGGARLFSGYSGWAPGPARGRARRGGVVRARRGGRRRVLLGAPTGCGTTSCAARVVSCRCSPPTRRIRRSIDPSATPWSRRYAERPRRYDACRWRSGAGGWVMTRIEGEDHDLGEDASAPWRVGTPSRRAARRPADVATLVEVLARAFDDDPVPQWLFRGDRQTATRPAHVLRHPASPHLSRARRGVHDQGPGRRGPVVAARQGPPGMAGPGAPRARACRTSRASGATPRGRPAALRRRRGAAPGPALVPGDARHRPGPAAHGSGLGAVAPRARPRRRRGAPRLPGVLQGEQPRLLRPTRLRGDR